MLGAPMKKPPRGGFFSALSFGVSNQLLIRLFDSIP
jgi:hypothetical protein